MESIHDSSAAARSTAHHRKSGWLSGSGSFALVLGFLSILVWPGMTQAYDEYVQDPNFYGGRYFVDAFSGDESRNYLGKKLVQLDNGDVVVAGLVSDPGNASDRASDSLGLVRYDSSGRRMTWLNPGPQGRYYNQYVVYPNASFASAQIQDVKDIQRIGNRLFVLVETFLPPWQGRFAPAYYPAGHAVSVLAFNTDGQFLGSTVLLSDRNTAAVDRDVSGAGIGIYSDMRLPETLALVFAGTDSRSGMARLTFRRYTVQSDSSLLDQTGLVQSTWGDACSTSWECSVGGLALGGRSVASAPPRIYISATHKLPGSDSADTLVAQVDPNGTPVPGFGDAGVYRSRIAGTAGSLAVRPGSLFAGPDTIYFLATSGDQIPCTPMYEVTALTQAGEWLGAIDISSVVTSVPCQRDYHAGKGVGLYAHAIAYANNKIVVAGYQTIGTGGANCYLFRSCPEDRTDAFITVFDVSAPTYPVLVGGKTASYTDATGVRTRHSGFWDVIANPNGSFTATGDVRFFQTAPGAPAGATQYATTRLVPPRH